MTRGIDGGANQLEELEGTIDADQAIALKIGSMSKYGDVTSTWLVRLRTRKKAEQCFIELLRVL